MRDGQREDAWWTRPGYQLMVLAGVVVVVTALVFALATIGSSRRDSLGYESRRLAIQFLLLTALGAVVTFLVDLEKRTREARGQRRKFEIENVSSMLEHLDAIYASAKTTRRKLRVDAARDRLNDDCLADHLLSLNHDQLMAERLKKKLKELDTQVSGLAVAAGPVEKLDAYLSDLWGKYEESPTPGTWLYPFVAPAKSPSSNFNKEFKEPYGTARGVLLQMLGAVSTRAR